MSYKEEEFCKAAKNGKLDIIKQLIDQVNINCVDALMKNSALMWAASNGHLYVVEFLVEKGAKVDMKTNDGRTALTMTSQKGKGSRDHREVPTRKRR